MAKIRSLFEQEGRHPLSSKPRKCDTLTVKKQFTNFHQTRSYMVASSSRMLMEDAQLTEFQGLDVRLFLAVRIDRDLCLPRIYANLVGGVDHPYDSAATAVPKSNDDLAQHKSSMFEWSGSPMHQAIVRHSRMDNHMKKLLELFRQKELYFLETWWTIGIVQPELEWKLSETRFGFDNAAYRSCDRNEGIYSHLQGLRNRNPLETEAENDGIVYIK